MKITNKQIKILAESIVIDARKEETISEIIDKRLSLQEKRIQLLKENCDLELIKEFNVQVVGPSVTTQDINVQAGGVAIETNFMKWATYLGISKAACATAVHIALISAGWEGVLAILIPAVLPILSSPVALGLIGAYLSKFSWFRKTVAFIFKMIIGKKNYERINNLIDNITDMMIKATNGTVDKTSALTLFIQSAGFVLEKKEFRSKLKELAKAYITFNKEKIKTIMSELDQMINNIAPSAPRISQSEEKEEKNDDLDMEYFDALDYLDDDSK